MLTATLASAREPVNLAINKQTLIKYHDSGAYMDDIADIIQQSLRYLELRVKNHNFKGKKPAIILDIDETSLSNYRDMLEMDFGGTPLQVQQLEDKGTDEVIKPTLKLYRFAKKNRIAVFFVTGRFEEEREVTLANLKKAGFTQPDGLILRTGKYKRSPAATYKIAVRKHIANEGYDILLNIGDQKSDLRGGYADKTFKLPNPYYLIP
jgi:predicted secreted acid phosphatase